MRKKTRFRLFHEIALCSKIICTNDSDARFPAAFSESTCYMTTQHEPPSCTGPDSAARKCPFVSKLAANFLCSWTENHLSLFLSLVVTMALTGLTVWIRGTTTVPPREPDGAAWVTDTSSNWADRSRRVLRGTSVGAWAWIRTWWAVTAICLAGIKTKRNLFLVSLWFSK